MSEYTRKRLESQIRLTLADTALELAASKDGVSPFSAQRMANSIAETLKIFREIVPHESDLQTVREAA